MWAPLVAPLDGHSLSLSPFLPPPLSLSLCMREHGERHRLCAHRQTQGLTMMLVFFLIFIFKICFLLQVSYTCRWIICNKPWIFLVDWCIWSWAPGVGRRKLWVVFQGTKVLTDSTEVDSIGRTNFACSS